MLLEKYKFYDIFRNINRIIINSKKIQTFIKKTFKEIEKIDFIDILIIYLKKRDRVFRFNRDYKINEKEIKNELKIILNKLEKEEYLIKKSENFLNYKYSIFFPLKYEKELIGLINFLSNNSIVLKRQNLVYLKEISNSINLGISKFIDKERIMEKEREHEKKLNLILNAFLKIIKMREPYTGDHSLRVSKISSLIGKELNLKNDSLKALKYASFLHDLGKIFVPSEILNKYGKLNEREYSLIKEHVIKSYEIVKDMNLPEPTDKIILQHHERLDGSGYPYGLKNDEILIEARILAVADVVDAMLSNRPYRASLSKEMVKDELNKYKGILYDEKVVEVALKIIEKLV